MPVIVGRLISRRAVTWVIHCVRGAAPLALALLLGSTWPLYAQITDRGQLAVRSDGFVFWIQDGVRHYVHQAALDDDQINAYPEGVPFDASLQPLPPTADSAPPADSAAPIPDGSSRAARLPLGQTCDCSIVRGPGQRSNLQIKVLAVDASGWSTLQQTNRANTPPRDGFDYLMVTLYIKYLTGPSDLPVSLDRFDFSLADTNGTLYSPAFVFEPRPLTNQTAYPDNELTGTVSFQVPRGDLDPTLVWRYNDPNAAWFALR